jgi:hypothetical protein
MVSWLADIRNRSRFEKKRAAPKVRRGPWTLQMLLLVWLSRAPEPAPAGEAAAVQAAGRRPEP